MCFSYLKLSCWLARNQLGCGVQLHRCHMIANPQNYHMYKLSIATHPPLVLHHQYGLPLLAAAAAAPLHVSLEILR